MSKFSIPPSEIFGMTISDVESLILKNEEDRKKKLEYIKSVSVNTMGTLSVSIDDFIS